MKIIKNSELHNYVEKSLLDDFSPEQISGRVRTNEKNLPSINKDAIYCFIKSIYGRKVEIYRRKQRQKRKPGKVKTEPLSDRVFIDKRPKYIQDRKRIGDVEADFIVSCKGGKGIILSLTDRKSRMTFLEKISDVSIDNVHLAFQRIKMRFPELKTITTDNDILFRKHKELERLLGVKIYFCHPYHSWEKGTVENTNGLVRRYIPKGSDISRYSKGFIRKIEEKLNRRPRKCLNYSTPNEILERRRRLKKKKSECSD